jgi:hypothetical protein
MLRSKVSGLIVLLVALAAVFAAPATSEQPAQKAGFRPCPDMKQRYTSEIKVRNLSCAKATRVTVRYTDAIIENLQHDWSVTVLGFHCDLTKKDYYGDSHRCSGDGGAVIRFRRGT